MTGRLNKSDHTSSRNPNGAATEKCRTSRPIGDHKRIGTENTAATRKRLRMSATIDDIDMWSCAACARCSAVIAACASEEAAAAAPGSASGSQTWLGTD